MVFLGSHVAVALFLAFFATIVTANVEKAVFVASSNDNAANSANAAATHADESLSLPRLTPSANGNAWRTLLPSLFAWSPGFPQGATTWLLLDQLTPGQRYELRVCWAATQPTAFSVDVYDAAHVLASPALKAELDVALQGHVTAPASATFARIVAAADYVTVPMSPDVPPVLADLILDPFLLNVLPRSLLPTVGAVLAVAVASAVLARNVVLPQLRRVAQVQ